MAELIKVDFSTGAREPAQPLPDAQEIFISQALSRVIAAQDTLRQRADTEGMPSDKQIAAQAASVAALSDHELLQAIHAASPHEIEAEPARFHAIITELYARPTVVALLQKHA